MLVDKKRVSTLILGRIPEFFHPDDDGKATPEDIKMINELMRMEPDTVVLDLSGAKKQKP